MPADHVALLRTASGIQGKWISLNHFDTSSETIEKQNIQQRKIEKPTVKLHYSKPFFF